MLPKKSMSVVLAEEATWWCAAHGVVLAPADKEERSRGLLAPAPVSLRPFRAPRDAFLAVSSLSPSLNRLMHAVACDHSFLRDTLSGCDPLSLSLVDPRQTLTP